MLRRKLGLRTDDLKELKVKPVPTWRTSRSHMAKVKAKLRRIRTTASQSKLLPLRRRIIRKIRVASCADILIIGQRSVQTTKEENINLSERLRTWLYPALEVELVGMIIYPMFFQCFNLPLGGLILVKNVHVCFDASLFSSYQITRDSFMMMGNGSHASVRGVGMVDLKLILEKIVQLKNVQHAHSINKNLVSGSLLCRDDFKVVLESNKFIVSKC
jgi:hypothetical protein